MFSCRHNLQPLVLSSGSNAGLLLARYLKKQKAEGDSAGIQAREELLTAAASIVGKAGDFYKAAFERRGKILGGLRKTFHVEGRMIIGLGASNVLETGLTLNHLYGTPIIPGSALKGLAAHYCSSIWGVSEQGFMGPSGEYYKFIFGSTEEEGFLTFHDAWITPQALSKNPLVRDVMTPHHGDYYMKQSAPSDFDDPNPVTFLSVKGDFEIHVSCESLEDESQSALWEKHAIELLNQALSVWGIGGKTSSGYGIGSIAGMSPVKQASASPGAATQSAPPVAPPAFSPDQKVEAIFLGLNKKQKPQFEVWNKDERTQANWKGLWEAPASNIAKGTKIQALVESYNPALTPKLTLKAPK